MIHGMPKRLQKMRTKYNFSQRQVAEKIGVSPSVISGYETGERTPSTEALLKLSDIYNCSTDFLLGKQSSLPAAILNADGLTAVQIQAVQTIISELQKNNR